MKILSILSLIFMISLTVCGQGNLQFNQVINMTNGQTYTVPAGKVLKVESINIANGSLSAVTPFVTCSSGTCQYFGYAFTIGDCQIFSFNNSASSAGCTSCPPTRTGTYSGISVPNIYLPIWLQAGKTVSVLAGTGLALTGIEFNIVP